MRPTRENTEARMMRESQPELVDFPTDAGKIVAMINYIDRVYVATEYGVYVIRGGVIERLKFIKE